MRFLRRLLQSGFRPPPSIARYNKLASAGTKTSAIAMVAYACTVAAKPVSDKPLDKNSKDHHVKNSRGETVKFQNPYPSHAFPQLSVFIPAVLYALNTPPTHCAFPLIGESGVANENLFKYAEKLRLGRKDRSQSWKTSSCLW